VLVLPSRGSGNIAANFVKFNVEVLVQAGSPKIAFPVLVSLSVKWGIIPTGGYLKFF